MFHVAGETPHLIFYSAHDNTLIGAFDIFGLVADEDSDLLLPIYATSMIVELWCVLCETSTVDSSSYGIGLEADYLNFNSGKRSSEGKRH